MWPFTNKSDKKRSAANTTQHSQKSAPMLAPQDAPLTASRPLPSVYGYLQPKA